MLRTLWRIVEAVGGGVWRLICALVGAALLGIIGHSRMGVSGLIGGAIGGLILGWLFGRLVGPEDVLT